MKQGKKEIGQTIADGVSLKVSPFLPTGGVNLIIDILVKEGHGFGEPLVVLLYETDFSSRKQTFIGEKTKELSYVSTFHIYFHALRPNQTYTVFFVLEENKNRLDQMNTEKWFIR